MLGRQVIIGARCDSVLRIRGIVDVRSKEIVDIGSKAKLAAGQQVLAPMFQGDCVHRTQNVKPKTLNSSYREHERQVAKSCKAAKHMLHNWKVDGRRTL